MNKNNVSYRLLNEIEFLDGNSEENVPVVIREMLDYLHKKGLYTGRGTLLKDLNALEDFNMGVTHKNRKYYYRKSVFSIEELMLIADAICYSNYIDPDNSKRLIEKIKTLSAKRETEKLNRQADVFVKPKPMNSLCISNAGKIHKAIMLDRKISFGYLHYDSDKRLVQKENFKKIVSPYKLVWDNSQYYLVGVDAEKGNFLVNYRVDKLFDLKITDEEREALKYGNEFYNPLSRDIDIGKYIKSVFFMYGSEKNKLTRINLRVHKSVTGAFIDKFGSDFPVLKKCDDWLEICVYVQLSPTFFGWIFQFGNLVEIITASVRQEYLDYLNAVLRQYTE